MAKAKIAYVCQQCGSYSSKWSGQCADCASWNCMVEQVESRAPTSSARHHNYSGECINKVTQLTDVVLTAESRYPSGLSEFDRVLGGGLISGSVVLLGGDPGIGKSTLLLQVLASLATHLNVLYVTGEESLQQVALRAQRLELDAQQIQALSETCIEEIISISQKNTPQVIVIDSIQTIYTDTLPSAAGSVSQVRECTAKLVQFAKSSHTAIFLVGHVTKEGALAGPRVLEHMVDTVLYFEGQADNRYRLIRAIKNRFGAANELGIFAMTEKGLREVNNPSAIFLSRPEQEVSGSVVMAAWEGTRPMLIEVQALVDQSALAQPRRVAVGIDVNRLTIGLAVLHRHGGISSYDQDVFVNIVGGVRVLETAVDLAVLLAVLSSFKNRPLAHDLIVFGEIGLSGEIRPVQGGIERLREAEKHGFKTAIIPKANARQVKLKHLTIHGVENIQEAINLIL